MSQFNAFKYEVADFYPRLANSSNTRDQNMRRTHVRKVRRVSNGAAKHKEAPLDNTLSCESLGLKTRHVEKWNMECNYADEILSISAKSLKMDGTAGQNMSTGQWTINVSTGVVKPGIPTGI